MRKVIHSLRQKPDHHKRRVAFGVAGIIMLGISSVWVMTFSYRFPGLTLHTNAADETLAESYEAESDATASAYSSFLDGIKSQLDSTNAGQTESNGVLIGDAEAYDPYDSSNYADLSPDETVRSTDQSSSATTVYDSSYEGEGSGYDVVP